jgi:hypothetical protein
MNACCSLNLTVSASMRAGILERRLPVARSARTSGSCSPLMSASSVAQNETPVRSLTTEASLISELQGTFPGLHLACPVGCCYGPGTGEPAGRESRDEGGPQQLVRGQWTSHAASERATYPFATRCGSLRPKHRRSGSWRDRRVILRWLKGTSAHSVLSHRY